MSEFIVINSNRYSQTLFLVRRNVYESTYSYQLWISDSNYLIPNNFEFYWFWRAIPFDWHNVTNLFAVHGKKRDCSMK